MSFLQTLGSDIKKVFAWVGSPKGSLVIGAAEGLAESAFPAATGAINLANVWITEIIKSEALATAAGQQNGSGTLKAAAVLNVVTPEVLAFVKAQNLPVPDAAGLAAANTALVAFLNALGAPAPKA